jgi:hypothetical protein
MRVDDVPTPWQIASVAVDRSFQAPEKHEIEEWLVGVRSELERIEVALSPLLHEQARLREREQLLLRLSQSFETIQGPADTRAGEPREPDADLPIREYVQRRVAEILRDAGEAPMHINDLHAKFLQRGFRVPGAGRPANLTAHLGRSETIISPRRGFYALATGATRTANPTTKRRRRRRRP